MRPDAIRSSTDLAQDSADGYSSVSTTALRMPRMFGYTDRSDIRPTTARSGPPP